MIGPLHILRSDPETVSTANHPLRLAFAAELFIEGLENIRPVYCAEADDTRPHIECDNEFDLIIGEPQIALPASVRDGFSLHKSADPRAQGTKSQSNPFGIFHHLALQGISLGAAAAVAGSAVRAAALSPPATTTSASVSDRECKPPRRLPQKQRNEYGLAFLHGK